MEAVTLLRQLVTASPDHRELAASLQKIVIDFRQKLRISLDEAWESRYEILDQVTESGGMGLDGGAGLQKAQDLVKGVVQEWKGVGGLVSA